MSTLNSVEGRSAEASSESRSVSAAARPKGLRWWPAALLVGGIFGLPQISKLFESAPLPVMMVAFMGPGLIGLLVMAWWLFASRAPIWEKLIGWFGLVLIAAAALWFLHPSLQGMGATINVIPAGATGFAIPLILLARRPAIRLPIALACSALAFGYWDLFQSKGVTGRFEAEFDWRWKQTAEEQYIASLGERKNDSRPSTEDLGEFDSKSAQWPSFRGPNRDGRQPNVVLNEDWSSSPPKVLWRVKVGPAWSSFSIAGSRLFTQEQRGDNEAVVCLNANTGETVWAHEYPGRFWEAVGGAGPRGTPTIADDGLFALGASGILSCLNPRDGKLIWNADLRKDADREPPIWGFAASPLVTGGLAIVHAGGKGELGVIAYDAHSGEKKWSTASGDHSYSSPQLATLAGVKGILMETNAGMQFLDAATGKQLWEHAWPVQNYRALQPLVLGDTVILASSLGGGTRNLKVSRDGEVWQVTELWTSRDLKPDFNDFVEHKGNLYGFDANIFCCTDAASGKRRWKRGRYGNGQVVLLPAADQLLITSETGELALVRADGESFTELAKVPAISGKTWNHPIVVEQRIYLRNAEEAACYQVALKSAQ